MYVLEYQNPQEYLEAFQKGMLIMFFVGIKFFVDNVKIDNKGFYEPEGILNLGRRRISLNELNEMFAKYTEKAKPLKIFKQKLYEQIPSNEESKDNQ